MKDGSGEKCEEALAVKRWSRVEVEMQRSRCVERYIVRAW